MLKRLLLSAALLSSPLYADDASLAVKSAKAHLAEACKTGVEHAGVYTPSDGKFHDIAWGNTQNSVELDNKALLPFCREKTIYAFHCHTNNDALSRFPSANPDGSSDIGTVAYLEYLCGAEAAEHDFTPPNIEHGIIHTGGTGTVTMYGLTAPLERVREIAKAQGATMRKITTDPASSISEMRGFLDRKNALLPLYDAISKEYFDDIISFGGKECPLKDKKWEPCEGFTLERFIETRTGKEPYFVKTENSPNPAIAERTATPSLDVKSVSKYPPWITELTKKNHKAFINKPHVMVMRCAKDNPIQKTCESAAEFANKAREYCYGLEVGLIDTDKRDFQVLEGELDISSIYLFEKGRHAVINLPHVTPYMFGLIFCGMHMDSYGGMMFPGASGTANDPAESLRRAMESLGRMQLR